MRRGESKKLNPLYEGMWEVIDIRGPNYLLRNSKTGKEKIMHHNELRRRPLEATKSGSLENMQKTEVNRVRVMFNSIPTINKTNCQLTEQEHSVRLKWFTILLFRKLRQDCR